MKLRLKHLSSYALHLKPLTMEQINENYRNQMLRSYNMIFVMDVLDKLNDVSISECYINHPSQVQHSCIMETPLTQLWTYFHAALEKVNMDIVMNKWQKEIAVLDIPFDSVKSFYELIISFEWRENHFPQTKSWKEDINKMCEKVIKLKIRLVGI